MAEATAAMPATQVTAQLKTPAPPTVDPSKTAGSAKVVGAPFQIRTLQERDRWLKMIVYAQHGVGKTELVGSAVEVPEMRDVLYIDLDNSKETLIENKRIPNWNNIYFVDVNTFQMAARIQEFAKAYCAARDRNDMVQMRFLWKAVSGQDLEKPPIFRTIIIDSLSELDAYSTYQILKVDINGNSVGDEMDTAGWPEFRKNLEGMKLMIRAFRDLPMNVLFTCAANWSQDQFKAYHYSPALTGKLGSQVQGFVDIVGYLVAGEVNVDTFIAPRKLLVQPITGAGMPKFDAKNRKSGYTKPWFDEANMEMIMSQTGMVKR